MLTSGQTRRQNPPWSAENASSTSSSPGEPASTPINNHGRQTVQTLENWPRETVPSDGLMGFCGHSERLTVLKQFKMLLPLFIAFIFLQTLKCMLAACRDVQGDDLLLRTLFTKLRFSHAPVYLFFILKSVTIKQKLSSQKASDSLPFNRTWQSYTCALCSCTSPPGNSRKCIPDQKTAPRAAYISA